MCQPTSKRLFFALWPDEASRQQCGHLISALRTPRRGKAVAADNLHVTLVFLGNVDAQQQQRLCQLAAQLKPAPMALNFDRLTFWRQPRIVCLTSSVEDPATNRLARELADIAVACGIEIDRRPYRPHVTLFRKLDQPLNTDFASIHWQNKDFCLVESISAETGVRYEVLQRWPSA